MERERAQLRRCERREVIGRLVAELRQIRRRLVHPPGREQHLEGNVGDVHERRVRRTWRRRQQRIAVGEPAPLAQPLRAEVHEEPGVVRLPCHDGGRVEQQQRDGERREHPRTRIRLPVVRRVLPRPPEASDEQGERQREHGDEHPIEQVHVGAVVQVIEQPHDVEQADADAEHQQQIDQHAATRAAIVEGDREDDGEHHEYRDALPRGHVGSQRFAWSAAPVGGERGQTSVREAAAVEPV